MNPIDYNPHLLPSVFPNFQELPNNDSSPFKVGCFQFQKICYDALEPGDIVCTYESTSTIPTTLSLIEYQNKLGSSEIKDLKQFIHFEIILKRHPRTGFYDIAHASGDNKQVITQYENFKNYKPGIAVMVFRPPQALAHEIVEIAKKTAEERKNPWKIRLVNGQKGILKRIKYLLQGVINERFSSAYPEKKIKKIARLAVDYYDKGGFYKKDGITPCDFSCVYYAATVLNVSVITKKYREILESNLSRNKKIKKISSNLKEAQKKEKAEPKDIPSPIEFMHPEVLPARLVNYFLKNPYLYKNIGYIGNLAGEEAQLTSETLSLKPITEDQFNHINIVNNFNLTANEIALTFRSLGLITSTGHLFVNQIKEDHKIQSAFIFLLAQSIGISEKVIFKCKDHPQEIHQILDNFSSFKSQLLNIKSEADLAKKNKSVFNIEQHLNGAFSKEEIEIIINNLRKSGLITKENNFKKLSTKTFNLKLKTIFAEYYSKKIDKSVFNLDKSDIIGLLNKDFKIFFSRICSADFYEHFCSDIKTIMQIVNVPYTQKELKDIIQNLPNYEKLPSENLNKLLQIEKELIKRIPDERIKNFHLSMNALEKEKIKIEKKQWFANRLIKSGLIFLVIPPIGLLLIGLGLGQRWSAGKLEAFYKNWQNEIFHLHHELANNTEVTLKTPVKHGERPWMIYSTNLGQTWDFEPMIEKGNEEWQAKIHVGDKDKVYYHFFIGPSDVNYPDPFGQAKAWQDTAVNEMHNCKTDPLKVKNEFYQLPSVNYPVWNPITLIAVKTHPIPENKRLWILYKEGYDFKIKPLFEDKFNDDWRIKLPLKNTDFEYKFFQGPKDTSLSQEEILKHAIWQKTYDSQNIKIKRAKDAHGMRELEGFLALPETYIHEWEYPENQLKE